MKQILILLFFIGLLNARENPFLPTDINDTDMIASNNINNDGKEFQTQVIKFPSDARELVKAVFYYKSIDGSIQEKIVDINASFNRHDEFILKKEPKPIKSSSKILDVSVTTQKNDKKSKEIIDETSNNLPNIEPPLHSFNFMKLIKFDIYPMKINIFTKDKMVRNFIIDRPNKIVMDFRKFKTGFGTKTFKINKGIIKKIVFGSHDTFYRVVIWLDGNYHYNIRQSDSGYTMILK